MTNGSSHSRCESNVHAWLNPQGLGLAGELDHARGRRVGLQHDAEVHRSGPSARDDLVRAGEHLADRAAVGIDRHRQRLGRSSPRSRRARSAGLTGRRSSRSARRGRSRSRRAAARSGSARPSPPPAARDGVGGDRHERGMKRRGRGAKHGADLDRAVERLGAVAADRPRHRRASPPAPRRRGGAGRAASRWSRRPR